jgi:hypothetical protein
MNFRSGSLIIIPLAIQIIVSLILAHFAIIGTGGITIGFSNAVPTSGWDIITNGFAFFGGALTFNIVGYAVISVFFWFLTICQFIGIILVVRGI